MDIWMVLHLVLFAKKNLSFKSMGLEDPGAAGHSSACPVACVLCSFSKHCALATTSCTEGRGQSPESSCLVICKLCGEHRNPS